MFIEKHVFVNRSNVILMLLISLFMSARITTDPQEQSDDPTEFFDMSTEEMMNAE